MGTTGKMQFNEPRMKQLLEKMPKPNRVAFAAAAAERLYPYYLNFHKKTHLGKPDVLRDALTFVWEDLHDRKMDEGKLKQLIIECKALIPEEDDSWIDETEFAENSVVAIIYTLECKRTGEAQDAIRAARRSYYTVDSFVTWKNDIDISANDAEEIILANPLVQAELTYQAEDLNDLSEPDVNFAKIRKRAESNAGFLLAPEPH